MAYKVIVLFILSLSSMAASCCGGGGGSNSIITSEHRSTTSLSYTNIGYLYDVDQEGVATKRDGSVQEVKEELKASYTHSFDNFTQFGINTNISMISKSNSKSEQEETILGDIVLSGAYEFLKEEYFSLYRPRGFFYTGLNVPTGTSKYEDSNFANGKGLYSLAPGLLLIKKYKEIDLSLDLSSELYFSDTINSTRVSRDASFYSSVMAGLSPNAGKYRIGVGVNYQKHGDTITNSTVAPSYYLWSSSLSLSYMHSLERSVVLTYLDETILGQSKNTSLSRSFSIKFNMLSPL